jgi:hypothetical protein
MSLFDRFVSVLKSGVAGGRPRDLEGPLQLRPGDHVLHYHEDFVVAGVRVLESEAEGMFLYCLQDENGERAVLSAVGGPSPEYTLQRYVDHDTSWESAEVVEFDEETYHFSGEGRCKLHSVGGSGVRGCRFVDFRLLGDEAGDQMLVLEDYAGTRETRMAEPLFEGEFEITRGERKATPSTAEDDVNTPSPSDSVDMDIDVVKGSPMAAAMAMSRDLVDDPSEVLSESQDEWSDAYDDDSWSDDEFDEDQPAHRPSKFAAKQRKARVIQASMPAPEDEAESEEVPASVFDTARGGDENWLGF